MRDKAYNLLYKNHLNKKPVLSTVSGILTTEPGMIAHFSKNVPSCDIITTKSYQLQATLGHREPIICSPSKRSFGNFVGLRNPGLDSVIVPLKRIKADNFKQILNISIAGNSIDAFIKAIRKVEDFADIVELNFSCPHADKGFGASIGLDKELVERYVSSISSSFKGRDFLLIIKLTPNATQIEKIAEAAINSGADGVALINTLGPFEYKDEKSGEVIFNKSEGGKGGLSGIALKEKALECIKKVRMSIGDEPIILGMGGIENAIDVQNMLSAGADSVGIGSTLSLVDFYDYEKYFKALKSSHDVSSLLKDNYNSLLYTKHEILNIEEIGDNCSRLELSGKLNAHAGEFVFLWIPQVGEKPFSVSTASPLSFVVKRRGEFTNKICDLKKGDIIYSRGPYGKKIEVEKSDKALLVAGGSGLATLPLIAEEVKKKCKNITIKIGLSGNGANNDFSKTMKENLSIFGDVEFVFDNGKPGRVIDSILLSDTDGDTKVYTVGPYAMMEKLCKICGIGMCGECFCFGKLPCKEGTFYKYSQILRSKND